MSQKRVAITGATGFLGRHVLSALRTAGRRPVAVVRDAGAARRILPDDMEIRQVDICDGAALTTAFEGMDAAIHLAGMVSVNKRDDRETYRVNVTGARNFLRAVEESGVARALFTSTTSAVGALSRPEPGAACDEATAFNLAAEPVMYIQAKRTAHEMALAAAEQSRDKGTRHVVLSPSFVLGPDDINSNTSELIDAIARRALPICPGGGLNPIDVRDLAAAYVSALDHPDPAGHYILASGENLTLKEFIGRVAQLAHVTPPRLSLPNALVIALARGAEFIHPGGRLTAAGARLGRYYWYFDAALARRDLSLRCRPLDDTVKDTLAWLRDKESRTPKL